MKRNKKYTIGNCLSINILDINHIKFNDEIYDYVFSLKLFRLLQHREMTIICDTLHNEINAFINQQS